LSSASQRAESGQNTPAPQITLLLDAWRAGNGSALDELVPLVETELRRLARGYLRRERPGHVLQTTALVNEAFVRLVGWQGVQWQNRAHFIAVAAQVMRHILVDMARRRARSADGPRVLAVELADAEPAVQDRSRDLMALDEALCGLAEQDPRKSQIVELRFFGGLTLEEIAEVIGVAPATVSREWAKARAWLRREVAHSAPKRPRS
jgi:RNA polymerase sigma factor (TIGR02999 family)